MMRAIGARCAAIAHFQLLSALTPPAGVELQRVETALELRDAVHAAIDQADLLIMNAAVADFRPAELSNEKIKKKGFEAQHSLAEGIQQLITCFRMLPPGPFANV